MSWVLLYVSIFLSQTHFIVTKLFTGQNMTNAQIKQEKYFGMETTLYYVSHLENSFLARMKLIWVLKNILGRFLTALTTRFRKS